MVRVTAQDIQVSLRNQNAMLEDSMHDISENAIWVVLEQLDFPQRDTEVHSSDFDV